MHSFVGKMEAGYNGSENHQKQDQERAYELLRAAHGERTTYPSIRVENRISELLVLLERGTPKTKILVICTLRTVLEDKPWIVRRHKTELYPAVRSLLETSANYIKSAASDLMIDMIQSSPPDDSELSVIVDTITSITGGHAPLQADIARMLTVIGAFDDDHVYQQSISWLKTRLATDDPPPNRIIWHICSVILQLTAKERTVPGEISEKLVQLQNVDYPEEVENAIDTCLKSIKE